MKKKRKRRKRDLSEAIVEKRERERGVWDYMEGDEVSGRDSGVHAPMYGPHQSRGCV